MKKYIFTIATIFVFGIASAQTDTTRASAIDNKVQQTNAVRKQQNLDANRSDPAPAQKMQTPDTRRPENTPNTTTTSTNNGSNKSSGNTQPSSTPAASNTPSGTGVNNNPPNNSTPGRP